MKDRRHRTTLAELWAGSGRSDQPVDAATGLDAGADGQTRYAGDPARVGQQGHRAVSEGQAEGERDQDQAGEQDAGRLVVLRGIPGTGKSSLAEALQGTDPDIAWIDQHALDRTLHGAVHGHGPADDGAAHTAETVALVESTVRFCLDREHTVVLEGTLRARDYGPMIKHLLAAHPGVAYYLDIPVQVARRRMRLRAAPDRAVEHPTSGDLLAIPQEVVIGQEPFGVTLARIRSDLDEIRTSRSRCG